MHVEVKNRSEMKEGRKKGRKEERKEGRTEGNKVKIKKAVIEGC